MEWFLKVLLGALLITSKSEAVKIETRPKLATLAPKMSVRKFTLVVT